MIEKETTIDSPAAAEPIKRRISLKKLIKYSFIVTLAFTTGYVHYRYVSHLFENDRNFSHLSETEREMSLRTETGFYYSYYKTIVQERPFMAGVTKLMYDRLVEHPTDVNAFNRFNIHPEVLIGAIYRYFEPVLNTTTYRQCHIVERGGALAPVESCVGIGQPILFYLEAVWVLAGLNVAALFLQATALSESILGGLLAVTQYFTNHDECTRVQWVPNERENMAAPLILMQLWLVGLQLRDRERRATFQLQVSIFIVNCICLLFWQFTQFIFLTQIAIFFVMEQLRIIDLKTLCVLLHSHFCGLHMAVLLLQGNDMLKSSLYTSVFIMISAYCLFFSSLRVKVKNRFDLYVESWLVVLRIAIVSCTSVYLKKIISDFLEVEEDSHVWDILYSKFTNFRNFHTLLYTCSEVFDFLPVTSVKKLFFSFLIPFVVLSLVNVLKTWLVNAIQGYRKEISEKKPKRTKGNEKEIKNAESDSSDDEDSGIENTEMKHSDLDLINKKIEAKATENDRLLCFLKHLSIEPAIFYNVSQMVVYGLMAALVMRLKLLLVPQMCVVSALMMNKKYYSLPDKYMRYIPFFWALSVLPVLQNLAENVSHEMSHIGEFTDVPQERLMDWILTTDSASTFAGSMPLLASVMLVTRRAIVAHPHYEHKQARQRAYTVYKAYGRFTAEELYEELNALRATYLVIEMKYCYGRSSKGCSFEQIWEVETGRSTKPILCRALLNSRVDHFYPVYRDQHYAVFKIHDYSVRYMPRSFDT